MSLKTRQLQGQLQQILNEINKGSANQQILEDIPFIDALRQNARIAPLYAALVESQTTDSVSAPVSQDNAMRQSRRKGGNKSTRKTKKRRSQTRRK